MVTWYQRETRVTSGNCDTLRDELQGSPPTSMPFSKSISVLGSSISVQDTCLAAEARATLELSSLSAGVESGCWQAAAVGGGHILLPSAFVSYYLPPAR